MPICEMCDNESNQCYKVDLRITPDFDVKDEEPFERESIICLECRNKIITVFPKVEDDFFNRILEEHEILREKG